MDFSLEPAHRKFIADFRSFLDESDFEWVQGRNEADALEKEGDRAFFGRLHDAGWQGVGWPEEFGGRGGSALDRWLYLEELSHRRLPRGDLTLSSVGPAIIAFGTDVQKGDYLPGILTGEFDFAVGYSEPDAGSDLGSLRTRAVRDGDHYVVNGQKVYITSAHYATHVWLAVRTDGDAPKHEGISVLVVDIDAPGVTIRPMHTQADGLTNEIFLDDVRVPVTALVGREGEGWRIITAALDLERNFPYSGLARDLEELIDWAATESDTEGVRMIRSEPVRSELTELAVDVEIARLFATRAAWSVEEGASATADSSMTKIWTSELRDRVAGVGLQMIGPAGQIKAGDGSAVLDGSLEQTFRWSPMMKIGGGANEIQRTIIARRGLGLGAKRERQR